MWVQIDRMGKIFFLKYKEQQCAAPNRAQPVITSYCLKSLMNLPRVRSARLTTWQTQRSAYPQDSTVWEAVVYANFSHYANWPDFAKRTPKYTCVHQPQ